MQRQAGALLGAQQHCGAVPQPRRPGVIGLSINVALESGFVLADEFSRLGSTLKAAFLKDRRHVGGQRRSS